MIRYGGAEPFLGYVGVIALSLFLSLFSGLMGIVIKKILDMEGESLFPLLLIPLIWIVKDIVVEHIFGGFPWCSAGYSQHSNLLFIQMGELGGIHLITFFVIYFNVLFFRWYEDWKNKRIALAIMLSFFCIYSVGFYLYKSAEEIVGKGMEHRAGIIQPNTSNDAISYGEKTAILNRLFDQSAELARLGAEFVIWPEHTVSIYPLQTEQYYKRITEFTQSFAPLLGGFTDLIGEREIYNSVMLFGKKENEFQKYDKVHLTPFGEYILFRDLLFFVKRITDEIADFTPGKGVKNLEIEGHGVSTPICYEIIFPELVRNFIAEGGGPKGGELIVTISNDSWFGNTSAPYQHLSMAQFRSIENRRYILRSTTNGISGVISPTGEILFSTIYLTEDSFIGGFKFLTRRTVFTKWGYLFPYFCVGLFLIIFMIRIIRVRRKK